MRGTSRPGGGCRSLWPLVVLAALAVLASAAPAAAGRDDAAAQFEQGQRLRDGRGAAVDRPAALALFRSAAAQGHAAAAYEMARHHRGLTGGAIDLPQAQAFLRRAAEGGHAPAQLDLAFALYDGRDGVARDLAAARQWFERAAKQGSVRAQCMLGDFHREGLGGTKVDLAAALRNYRAAAATEDPCAPRAQFALYRAHAGGEGVPRDLRVAVQWLQRAADRGERVAQLALSHAYRDGQGVESNAMLARHWWRKSRDGVAYHDDHEHDLPSFAGAAPAVPAQRVATGGPRTIGWDALLPAQGAARGALHGVDIASLKDNDPRAAQLLARLREAADRAPPNPRLDGVAVRVPGYVVPLEQTPAGVSEFLLVPHFGACIHTPPPPANQIVHVRLKAPMRTLSSMDAVWISGELRLRRADTTMGASGYAMDLAKVEPYTLAK